MDRAWTRQLVELNFYIKVYKKELKFFEFVLLKKAG